VFSWLSASLAATARRLSPSNTLQKNQNKSRGPIFEILKLFSPKILAIFIQNTTNYAEQVIMTLVLEKIAIFRRKLVNIAINSDNNIDPRFFCV
jgi:hypothetical protein